MSIKSELAISGVPCCNSPARCHHNSIYIWLGFSNSENINSEEGPKSQRIQATIVCKTLDERNYLQKLCRQWGTHKFFYAARNCELLIFTRAREKCQRCECYLVFSVQWTMEVLVMRAFPFSALSLILHPVLWKEYQREGSENHCKLKVSYMFVCMDCVIQRLVNVVIIHLKYSKFFIVLHSSQKKYFAWNTSIWKVIEKNRNHSNFLLSSYKEEWLEFVLKSMLWNGFSCD